MSETPSQIRAPCLAPATGSLDRETLEREWQFAASDLNVVEAWIATQSQQFGFVLEPGKQLELTDTYLDTDKWAFHRAGYAFRLRQRDDQWQATFKALSNGEAFKSRREITQPIDFQVPQLLGQGPGRISNWLQSLSGSRPIKPLFLVLTRRKTFCLKRSGQRWAQIALDRIQIASAGLKDPSPFYRVEIEGDRVAQPEMIAYVDALCSDCRLKPARQSKFQTGLELKRLDPCRQPDLGAAEVASDMPIGAFVFATLRRHFQAFLLREPGTRVGEDAEELHQMRVSTRRLRAALKMYAGFLPKTAAKFNDTLRWIGQALGEVRDLDVKIEQQRAWLGEADETDHQAFAHLIDVLVARRHPARQRMLDVLDSARYEKFVAAFGRFLMQGTGRPGQPNTPAAKLMPQVIQAAHDRVLKAGKHLKKDPTPERYHRLRLACKHERYALEFVTDLFGGHEKPLRKRLSRLQEVLGGYMDAVTAIATIRNLLAQESHQLPAHALFTLGKMHERYQIAAHQSLSDFSHRHRKFKKRSGKDLARILIRVD